MSAQLRSGHAPSIGMATFEELAAAEMITAKLAAWWKAIVGVARWECGEHDLEWLGAVRDHKNSAVTFRWISPTRGVSEYTLEDWRVHRSAMACADLLMEAMEKSLGPVAGIVDGSGELL